jgi:hypothetical protein
MNAATIRHSIATAAAHAAAWVIGLTHEVPQHHLSDEECEGTGRPLGSTVAAVHVVPLVGARWWSFDAWTDEGDGQPGDRCLNLRVLGMSAEVFFKARSAAPTAAA